MFAFTWMAGKQDTTVNSRRELFCFRIQEENNHVIGDLIPKPGETLKFGQLYIYDPPNEIWVNPFHPFTTSSELLEESDNPDTTYDTLKLLWIFVRDKMSRDVITVGSKIRIPLLYRGEYSQWCERFMNYLEEKTDGEAMINSIQNGDQPLPVVAQVSLAGNAQNAPLTLKDLNNKTAKDLWDALEGQMRGSEYGEQDRKATILYEYETFKAIKGEQLLDTYLYYLQVINDLKKCGYKKDNCELNYKFLNNLQPEWKQYGTLVRQTKNLMDINIDALYNILKQNQVDVNDDLGYKKKAVMVTSDPLALVAEKRNELKKITALLAKAFSRRKFYSKPTNNNLRTSSTSQSANKKQEFVKTDDKKEDKKADEKKRDMSKVKCYNCKKEGHFSKDCKKAKVKDYNYYKTKMLLAKKDSDEQVLLAEDQAWVLSESDESSSSAEETITEVAYYTSESESESEFETSKYYDNSTNYGLFVNNDDDQEILHDAIKSASLENPSYFEKAKDLRPSLYDEKVIGLGYTLMFLIHSDEALEIEKFKRARENKIEFAYDYGNLNASYVNEKIIFLDDYFQEIINPDFEKIDSPFQQESSFKLYVLTVILEKIIIDLEDEVVSLLEKEKANLKTIKSLKSKGFESSENAISKSESQSENDCQVVEKECDQVENSKVIAPGMFKLSVSQNLDTFSSVRRPKNRCVIWKKKWSSNTSNVDLSSVSVSKLNKNVKRYSRKDLLSCNNSHIGETSSAYVCNDAMNVSCNSRMCDLFDENNLFIFDDESVRISPVSKMPFRKKPRDSMNAYSKSNSNKSLPRTVHRWLPKMQPLAESIVQICLWIIDSGCSKHMTGNRALLTNFMEKFFGTVRFGNNDFVVIAGYGDVVIGSMTINKSTCFVRNKDGVDFLTGDRSSNLYTIVLNEVASNSLICILAKASSSQSWLWHQRLSHLNFTTINNLVKNNLVHGLPKMKFKKDHLCFACEQGTIHWKHHKSKTAFASNKPLYLLHMDLCGPMRVESINGKRYVLVVVDDYSQYTWVFFLHSKDEASEETFAKFFDEVGITQQFSAARTPQQNGVVERRNRTLVEVARTMLTFANLPLFLWAEAIATACFTKNRLIIHKRFDKTPYKLMKKRKPNIKFFHVFGCRCYLLNDYEDVRKLKAKRDIGVFVDIQKSLLLLEFTTNELEKVYVGQPLGFVSKQYPDHVYALDKALYGLKQAPRAWYDVLSQFLLDSGFQKVSTPMVERAKLKLDLIGKLVNHTNYRSMIGSLMYVTSSRPDIMFATCMCARYQMRTQLTDYGFFYEKVLIYCDSKRAIAISCNPVHHTRTKHIDTYSCALCGNDHHYDFDCLPRFSLQDLNLKLNSNEPLKELFKDMKSLFELYRQQEQAAKLSTHTHEPSRRFNPISYNDDDDYDYKKSTIPLNEINSQIPPSIVITTSPLVLPIEDPEDSLIMGNEDLNTIPKKESDEFIKSSVEDLVPIPSESEDTSGSDSECILPSCDDDEINVLDCEDGYYDSEGDIFYLESLLNDDLVHHDPSIPAMSVTSILEGFTNEPPLEEKDDLFDLESKNDDWKKILYDVPIDDLINEDKIFDPGIHDQIFSPTYVSLPFEDCHYLFFTYVVRIFLPHFTYLVVSPFLISSESEDTIFDPGISVFHFSHRIAPDLEACRARGFVHHPLELQSLAYGNPIS
uniref:Retrovirus-related Pol polyprotein from transposon TNT 1-94 n=1 Tax=Tanacetum cinerariifolium TaxID=118510 RepID=A0A6L2MIL4_TANCI|nr:hypothetical protein [Tanacetum cinerariifolium]